VISESQRLRASGADGWAAAVAHPMVAEIGAGSLPHATFRFYFEQNLGYLREYARAIAFAATATTDRGALSTLARFLGQIADVEIPANEAFLERLGGSPPNHGDVALPWSGPRRCGIAVVLFVPGGPDRWCRCVARCRCAAWCGSRMPARSAERDRHRGQPGRRDSGARRPAGPHASGFRGIVIVRSLREAVADAQPLLGTSAGTRGRSSQPPVSHEDLVHPRRAVPPPSAADR
jgi:hypothetical protein